MLTSIKKIKKYGIANTNMTHVSCHNLRFKGKQSDEQDEIVKYSPNPQHRDNNPHKSQWIIMEPEEIQCFQVAYDKGWKKGNDAWGLHFRQNNVAYLGRGEDRSVELFIAKFKNDAPHDTWHGYPADYQRKSQDIPDRNTAVCSFIRDSSSSGQTSSANA